MSISDNSLTYILNYIKNNNIKSILEIGTYRGYSAIEFSKVAESIITIEKNKEDIQKAKENFKGFKNIILLEGDAKEIMKSLNNKFDLVFIDAKKSEYGSYLKLSLKLTTQSSVIFVDNTISHKHKMMDLFEYLKKSDLNWEELNLGKGLIIISKSKQ